MSLIISHKVSIHLWTVIQHFYSPILFFFVSSTVSCVRYSFECSCYIFHHVSQNTLPTSLPQSFLSKLPSNLRAAHYAVGNHHCNFERFVVVQIVIPYTVVTSAYNRAQREAHSSQQLYRQTDSVHNYNTLNTQYTEVR